MNRIKIDLKHCYGIKSLKHDFDYSKTPAYALYAPNGVMKSSLAQTFQDAAEKKKSEDRIFKARQAVRKIVDEAGQEIEGRRVLVVTPYNEQLGLTEQTSTLLLEPKLKAQFDELLRATAEAKAALLSAVQKQSGTKKNVEAEISTAFTRSSTKFDEALVRIKVELEDVKDPVFANIEYDKIFNDKVLEALNTKDLKNAVQEYVEQYNHLLEASTYFKRGTFDYYNAGQIAKSLSDNGFFTAKHTLSLNAASGNREIKNQKDLEEVVSRKRGNSYR